MRKILLSLSLFLSIALSSCEKDQFEISKPRPERGHENQPIIKNINR